MIATLSVQFFIRSFTWYIAGALSLCSDLRFSSSLLHLLCFSRDMARTGLGVSVNKKAVGNSVPGVTYIGVLKDSPGFGARPLVAGIVTLRGQSCLTWDQFKKTASLVGKDYFLKTVVQCNDVMSLEGVNSVLAEVVSTMRWRYEDKYKAPLSKDLPVILPGIVHTAPEFVDACINLQELPPNSLFACKGPKPSPPAPTGGAPPTSSGGAPPTSIGGAPSSSTGGAPTTSYGDDGQLFSASSAVVTPSASWEGDHLVTTSDVLSLVVQTEGIDQFVSLPEVVVDDGGGNALGDQVELDGGSYEDDRLVEDMVELIEQNMSPGDKEHDVVKKFIPTIRRLQKSLKHEREKYYKLSKLSMLQDTEIKSIQQSSAESLAPGLTSSVKQAFGSIQDDVKKILEEGLKKMEHPVKEGGEVATLEKLEALRLSIVGLTSKLDDVSQLSKNAMGASFKIDWNLSSVGLGARKEPARPVDIPSLLQEILSALQRSHPPPPVRPSVDTLSAPPTSPGFTTPSAPPRRGKGGRWDHQDSPQTTPATSTMAPKSAGRSLNAVFDAASGGGLGPVPAAARPGGGNLAADMERASGVWPTLNPVLTSDQIDRRIEQLSSNKKPKLI